MTRPLLIEQVITAKRRRSTQLANRKPHKPRMIGALEVRTLPARAGMDWTPCDAGCNTNRGNGNKVGRRAAASGLFVMGRLLGVYCEACCREQIRVWEDNR